MTSRTDAVFLIHYDTSYEPIATPRDLNELLDDDADMINPQGTRGMRYFLGVQDSDDDDHPLREPTLRLDLDPETGAAALRWLDSDLIGVESGYVPRPLQVCESSASDLVIVAAAEARVSYGAARAAAERYIATGERPDNVAWEAPRTLGMDHRWPLDRRNLQNLLIVCHSHHEAIRTFERLVHNDLREGILQVASSAADRPTMEIAADVQGHGVVLRYVGIDGTWVSRGSAANREMSKWLSLLQYRHSPHVDVLVSFDRAHSAIDEFYESDGARPDSVEWQPV